MLDSAKRRLTNISSHFDLTRKVEHAAPTRKVTFDVSALQRLLEHDNWETRQKLKELMRDELFVPYVDWALAGLLAVCCVRQSAERKRVRRG